MRVLVQPAHPSYQNRPTGGRQAAPQSIRLPCQRRMPRARGSLLDRNGREEPTRKKRSKRKSFRGPQLADLLQELGSVQGRQEGAARGDPPKRKEERKEKDFQNGPTSSAIPEPGSVKGRQEGAAHGDPPKRKEERKKKDFQNGPTSSAIRELGSL
jgi:hypothetical protein